MQRKSKLLYAIAALSFGAGLAGQLFYPGQLYSPASAPFDLASVLLTYYWVRIDAAERLYRRSSALNVCVVAFSLFAIPYYLLRSRGARRGLAATGWFILLLIAIMLSGALGEWAAEGLWHLRRPGAA